jgi:periplasmic protein TonB
MRRAWAWCVGFLPEDRTNRYLVVTVLVSLLLHVLIGTALLMSGGLHGPNLAKRGEPLFVDIAPDRPKESAPLGNPARPVGPDTGEPEKPRPIAPPPAKAQPPSPPARPVPPAPRVAEAPKPAPRAPEPRELTKAAPQPPPPAAKSEEPAYEGRSAQPAAPPQTAKALPEPQPQPQPQQPAAPSPGSEQRVAAVPQPTTPPSGMFRTPGGGGGLKGGRGGIEGEPIPLDTPEPKFQDYFNRIREQIKRNWIYPREAGDRGIEGELLIEFGIAKGGELQFILLRRTSGIPILDEYALRAVKLASPFPPVPDVISKGGLPINGIFRYQIVGASLLNNYLR